VWGVLPWRVTKFSGSIHGQMGTAGLTNASKVGAPAGTMRENNHSPVPENMSC